MKLTYGQRRRVVDVLRDMRPMSKLSETCSSIEKAIGPCPDCVAKDELLKEYGPDYVDRLQQDRDERDVTIATLNAEVDAIASKLDYEEVTVGSLLEGIAALKVENAKLREVRDWVKSYRCDIAIEKFPTVAELLDTIDTLLADTAQGEKDAKNPVGWLGTDGYRTVLGKDAPEDISEPIKGGYIPDLTAAKPVNAGEVREDE